MNVAVTIMAILTGFGSEETVNGSSEINDSGLAYHRCEVDAHKTPYILLSKTFFTDDEIPIRIDEMRVRGGVYEVHVVQKVNGFEWLQISEKEYRTIESHARFGPSEPSDDSQQSFDANSQRLLAGVCFVILLLIVAVKKLSGAPAL